MYVQLEVYSRADQKRVVTVVTGIHTKFCVRINFKYSIHKCEPYSQRKPIMPFPMKIP